MSNHADIISRVLAQRDAVAAGVGQAMPLSIKLTNVTDEPVELAEYIGNAIGRQVVVTVVAEQTKSTRTSNAMTMDESIQKFYDDAAKRFKDGESDKTVADAIGGGVLFGWVARIREELFGPDTRNQEVEALRKDLGKLADDIQAHQAELRRAREAVKAVESKVNALVPIMAALKSRVDKVA